MRFSSFTPTQRPDCLGEAFDSLVAQTFTDWEWVLVPNGPRAAVSDHLGRPARLSDPGAGQYRRARCRSVEGRVEALRLQRPATSANRATPGRLPRRCEHPDRGGRAHNVSRRSWRPSSKRERAASDRTSERRVAFEAKNRLGTLLDWVASGEEVLITRHGKHRADRHRPTLCDASYLELAQRLDLPLATLDQELRWAADAIGVPLFGNLC